MKIKKYKPGYKSKDKIPEKYFEGLNRKERKLMTEEILKRPQSLKYWSADKAYSERLKKEKKTLPKGKYTLAYYKKYGKENAGSLDNIARVTGIELSILKKVHQRGVGAWNGIHRPGIYPNQWAKSRIFSFVMGGKTRKTADRDLWELHLKNKRKRNPILENLIDSKSKAELIAKKIVRKPLKFLADGGEGYLFIFFEFGQTSLIKIFKNSIKDECINKLKDLSKLRLIPKIFDINANYAIMNYVNGKNLWELDDFTKEETIELYNKIKNVLSIWHNYEIPHGDLDPGNILVKQNGDVFFIDPSCNFNNNLFHKDEKDLIWLKDFLFVRFDDTFDLTSHEY